MLFECQKKGTCEREMCGDCIKYAKCRYCANSQSCVNANFNEWCINRTLREFVECVVQFGHSNDVEIFTYEGDICGEHILIKYEAEPAMITMMRNGEALILHLNCSVTEDVCRGVRKLVANIWRSNGYTRIINTDVIDQLISQKSFNRHMEIGGITFTMDSTLEADLTDKATVTTDIFSSSDASFLLHSDTKALYTDNESIAGYLNDRSEVILMELSGNSYDKVKKLLPTAWKSMDSAQLRKVVGDTVSMLKTQDAIKDIDLSNTRLNSVMLLKKTKTETKEYMIADNIAKSALMVLLAHPYGVPAIHTRDGESLCLFYKIFAVPHTVMISDKTSSNSEEYYSYEYSSPVVMYSVADEHDHVSAYETVKLKGENAGVFVSANKYFERVMSKEKIKMMETAYALARGCAE